MVWSRGGGRVVVVRDGGPVALVRGGGPWWWSVRPPRTFRLYCVVFTAFGFVDPIRFFFFVKVSYMVLEKQLMTLNPMAGQMKNIERCFVESRKFEPAAQHAY